MALLLVLASSACKSRYESLLDGGDVDAKYKAAFEYFNAGKYQKAAQLFESLGVVTPGTERDDTVQYYCGLSNYRNKDYYTAQTNFEMFCSHYPRSPFAESAEFLRVDCLYRSTLRYELDQMPTYTAITAISEYQINHPGSVHDAVCQRMLDDLHERLDKKAYENAIIYYRMEDYKAARVALRNILRDNSDNRYREDILYYIAMSSYKYADMSVTSKQKDRFLVFYDDYLNFIGEYPENKKRSDLDKLYAKAKEKY